MNKTCKFLLSLAFLLGGCVHGDPAPTAPKTTELQAKPLQAPLLWEVQKGKDKSYLFGTVHVGVDADKDLPQSVWTAFSDSPCFIMEADQSEIDPRAMMAMAKLPQGEKLSDKVTPQVWDKIQTDLSEKLPSELLLRSRPWF